MFVHIDKDVIYGTCTALAGLAFRSALGGQLGDFSASLVLSYHI